jgi:hypothetical protein
MVAVKPLCSGMRIPANKPIIVCHSSTIRSINRENGGVTDKNKRNANMKVHNSRVSQALGCLCENTGCEIVDPFGVKAGLVNMTGFSSIILRTNR